MQISIGTQILSFAGAMLILVAYIAHQTRWMDSRRAVYNLLNTVGAAILAWIALRPLQVGFVVLEVTWTLVSAIALVQALKSPPSTIDSPQ
jgi:vacuolar-type H+-ATPase subunit I/STV1